VALAITVLALAAGHPAIHEHPPVGCNTLACERRVRAHQHRVRYHCDQHPHCFRRVRRHRRFLLRRAIASMAVATASWYYDAGATASGRHYRYGFASLRYGSEWGKHVRFCYRMRCTTGRLDDHGPYIAGRTFDLNPALKQALGCSDLCAVHYRAR
jgi:hypothetical protein